MGHRPREIKYQAHPTAWVMDGRNKKHQQQPDASPRR